MKVVIIELQSVISYSYRRYFPPRAEIKYYNIEIEGRSFYDQPINNQGTNDLIK